MGRDIVVLGTAGTGYDVIDTLEAINQIQSAWNILGFLDDNPAMHGTEFYGYGVLGGSAALTRPEFREVAVVIAVANERNLLVRKTIAERLALPPERYPVICHPTCVISPKTQIAHGCILLGGSATGGYAKIGAHVIVLQRSGVGHDAEVADYVTICAHASVAAHTKVGEGAYISTGALLRPGIKVGAGSKVGIGSVALRNVPPGVTVYGNPAVVLDLGAPAVGQTKKQSAPSAEGH